MSLGLTLEPSKIASIARQASFAAGQEPIDLVPGEGVELDPWRAGRTVASGRGGELRNRLLSGGSLEAR
jgi:hypothetical protein